MTELYYVENILPHFKTAYDVVQEAHPGWWLELEEDGDKSHGRGTGGLADEYRKEHGITTHWHPASSPDMSPIEACWNILKNRFRRVYWETPPSERQMRDKLIEIWDNIDQKEIQKRFDELPARMARIHSNGGKQIRSSTW